MLMAIVLLDNGKCFPTMDIGILIAACVVVLISLGVRQTFGLFFMDFKNDLDISITQSGLAIDRKSVV